MQTEMPFFDHPEDALRACIESLGGAKKVGHDLFPDKTMENAREYLLACVNPSRAEKLSISQILFILREAKLNGFHTGFEYLAREAEYDSRPISKQDEENKLACEIGKTTKILGNLLERAERLTNK